MVPKGDHLLFLGLHWATELGLDMRLVLRVPLCGFIGNRISLSQKTELNKSDTPGFKKDQDSWVQNGEATL